MGAADAPAASWRMPATALRPSSSRQSRLHSRCNKAQNADITGRRQRCKGNREKTRSALHFGRESPSGVFYCLKLRRYTVHGQHACRRKKRGMCTYSMHESRMPLTPSAPFGTCSEWTVGSEMRPAEMIRALAGAVFLGLAVFPVQRSIAGQQASSLKVCA